VLDTNVWLDLLHFHDPRCSALADALDAGNARALACPALRTEWLRVLGYAHFAFDPQKREALDQAWLQRAEAVPAPTGLPALPRCSDPDDQKFLELAVAQRAEALLSKDKAVLKLRKRALRDFGLKICLPEEWAR
jgi:uncharacterized protein